MKVGLEWRGGVAFEARSGRHVISLDGPPDFGGQDGGFRPMELVLAAAAACSASDVVHILKKGKQPLDSLSVEADAERGEGVPKVFQSIRLTFRLSGERLQAAPVARAVALSVEKYCSVLKMLEQTVAVSHRTELNGDML